MTIEPKFAKAQPVNLKKPPVVLRFKGLWPRDLRRFKFHDDRRGGDLSHVDENLSAFNEVLYGNSSWDRVIREEIAEMKLHNYEERLRALNAKSRLREAREVEAEGPVVPWRASKEGPLREGILTVNKEWFGGGGQKEWDPKRVAKFREVAMSFLRENFSDDQLRYASGHLDEEAYHIHFIVASWTEKLSANRGRQVLLQPSTNPLVKSYEHAQDVAGKAFRTIGITRGERRAEARRKARAEGKPLPEKREHVAPSKWRAEERRKAQAEKDRILGDAQAEVQVTVEDGRDLAKATVKKTRKRAIKEARARKKRADKEIAEANRCRDAAHAKALQLEKAADAAKDSWKRILTEVEAMEPKVKGYEARAEEAVEIFQAKTAALKAEEEKLERVAHARNQIEQALNIKKEEVADLAGQEQQLTLRRREEETAAVEARAARITEEKRLKEAEEKVRLKVAEVDVITDSIKCGLDLIAGEELSWQEATPDQQPRLTWGASAPRSKGERSEKLKEMKPALPMIKRLAQLVTRTVERVLTKERLKLRKDAEYVLGLRERWEPEAQARLVKIARSEPG